MVIRFLGLPLGHAIAVTLGLRKPWRIAFGADGEIHPVEWDLGCQFIDGRSLDPNGSSRTTPIRLPDTGP
jgi:hypothetical protein